MMLRIDQMWPITWKSCSVLISLSFFLRTKVEWIILSEKYILSFLLAAVTSIEEKNELKSMPQLQWEYIVQYSLYITSGNASRCTTIQIITSGQANPQSVITKLLVKLCFDGINITLPRVQLFYRILSTGLTFYLTSICNC